MSSNRLYLERLPDDVSEQQVERCLSIYGQITRVVMHSGYTMVEFASKEDAMDALSMFFGRQFLGADVKPYDFEPRKRNDASISTDRSSISSDSAPRSQSTFVRQNISEQVAIVVANLSPDICWQELKDFGRIGGGSVAFCYIHRTHNRVTGFIHYYSREDSAHAVRELNGRKLLGRVVKVFPYDRPSRLETRPRNARSRSPRRRYSQEEAVGYGKHVRDDRLNRLADDPAGRAASRSDYSDIGYGRRGRTTQDTIPKFNLEEGEYDERSSHPWTEPNESTASLLYDIP
ncbi:uncharacterized protein LAESUDRAFT_808336 [Laetiporus sulphureus 93-53]|uniref:RRM domain-containing protein n=1 Tax=Laetiporus sulphureus 93-53 TaxID=1314785 RepID=A0A165IAE1_9APHY|nr:uncharacterized protein LAESUDRAFT_808336 [Laetiporus sulphureus 93-53]KZT12801.1 hypothetical protein LAESUDRAFT_808336 [Laetiporus sulphureus 93-53]